MKYVNAGLLVIATGLLGFTLDSWWQTTTLGALVSITFALGMRWEWWVQQDLRRE